MMRQTLELRMQRHAENATMSPEDRKEFGITDSLIRFSVGIENVADIIEDLERALG